MSKNLERTKSDFVEHFNGKDKWLQAKYAKDKEAMEIFNAVTIDTFQQIYDLFFKRTYGEHAISKLTVERELAISGVLAVTIRYIDDYQERKICRNIPNKLP